MKKTFPFSSPGRERARVVDAIKNDVRKYVKRERKKTPAEGFDLWEFSCRVGPTPDAAVTKAVKELSGAIDEAAGTDAPAVYVEILAVPGKRPARTAPLLPP